MWKKQGAVALGKFSIFGRIWKTGQKKTWEFFPGNFFHTVSNRLIILPFCGPAPPDKFWKFSPVLRHGNILHIPQKIPGPSLSDYSTLSDKGEFPVFGNPPVFTFLGNFGRDCLVFQFLTTIQPVARLCQLSPIFTIPFPLWKKLGEAVTPPRFWKLALITVIGNLCQ